MQAISFTVGVAYPSLIISYVAKWVLGKQTIFLSWKLLKIYIECVLLTWEVFTGLNWFELQVQKKVRAMCAVMRIAVALDRCDTNAIEHVHVYQQPESVMLVSSLPSVSNLIRMLHLLESFFLPFLTIDLASL